MKSVKSELTKLKNTINQKINKEYDWLDSGITSVEIMQEIEKTYALLDKFDNVNNSLEIAYAKYHCLKLIKHINYILNKRRETKKWDKRDVLSFIAHLVKLRLTIRELYFIEIKGEFRTEEERQAIAADITKIKENLSEHIALEEQLIKDQQEFAQLQSTLSTLKKSYDAVQKQADEITEWHTKTDELTDEIIEWHEVGAEQSKSIELLSKQSEIDKPKIEAYKKEIEEMIKLFKKQKEEIQDIIDDANRASMAGSFKKQMEDINKKMKWADGFLIGSLIITALFSLWGFQSSFITPQNRLEPTFFSWSQFLAKSAISLPFLIVAWIKAKERAYLFRLREDYGYKYSSAMAFEGYRKQVQEQSPELEEQLLQIAVDNLGSNPTKVFERDLKSTPLETIIDGVGRRLDKAVEGIKGQVKDIPQKTKELIDE
ncbi:hypothetical protein SAMN05421675_0185 [Pasteurella multocida]|uniref:hypothetical protein n=1 Tax=Pasteurella multocida TaxID=747 RepID=UPI0008E947BD|nr:hypothetical protein [Pasteurella multocida]MDY0642769.1 hypothetical protein [Pasteurella multocida]MEE3748069.1 hypothetical protein [Pasteurella multocida]SFO72361.1 hypothetical protein SAMN05421675_0185 [Pasteurella multocida]VEE38082.1 Uncharacterised protein [Pasteurella multocida subsp. gallicida]HDR0999171.1 hypothetical protein [Pasteurella multocida]